MNLDAIKISNFRSIRGTVTVPLDAPVVLIHGLNGAGKTSVLAAIELALTGQFAGAEPSQPGVLVHRGFDQATIQLDTTGRTTSGTLAVKGLDLSPILNEADARFYSERCYLTQARLGRLLEIYQSAEGRTDTPLTRFIKDLLRLDRLDALVDGLHAVGDKRNLRKLVPSYPATERQLGDSRRRVVELRTSLDALTGEREALANLVRANAASLGAGYRPGLRPGQRPGGRPDLRPRPRGIAIPEVAGEVDPATWQSLFADDGTIETELTALTGARREMSSAQRRLQTLASPDSALIIAEAEAAAATARQLADEWWRTAGTALEGILDDLRGLLPDLPSIASSGPSEAFATALSKSSAELDRCATTLSKDTADRLALESLGERIAQGHARLATIDSQIEGIGEGGGLEALTQALSELVPHVQGDDCPVCGRDFSEVSTQPLQAALTSRIANLGESAARLQSLIGARSGAASDIRRTQNQHSQIEARLLPDAEKLTLERRAAALRQNLARLRADEDRVGEGASALRAATATATALARENEANRAASEVDIVVSDVAFAIGMAAPEADSAHQKIVAVRSYIDARISALEERLTLLTQTRAAASQLSAISASVHDGATKLDAESNRVDSLAQALATAEQRREIAKRVSNKAVSVRTSIARKVFNDSLNKLWRELFIRLAPGEPYVPAFRLPEGAGTDVIAELQTVHRDGEAAGSPQAMLSAGNLNTAALTLFLALHLSATPQLPWLVLDDPVQSMDEMHVAQLAALLRTVSRQHERQVILAIHERPLFDYLSLELSPGRPKDRLITIELSRERGGDTLVRPTYLTFEEDRAVPAA